MSAFDMQKHVQKFIQMQEDDSSFKRNIYFSKCMGSARSIWDVLKITEEEYNLQYNQTTKIEEETEEPVVTKQEQVGDSENADELPAGGVGSVV